MKRSGDRLNVVADGQAAEDPEWGERYPLLYEHLTSLTWEDGKPREVSTLLLFAEHGLWKACLNDRAEGRAVFLADQSIAGLLEALETGLRVGDLDWRIRTRQGGRRG